MTTNDEQYREVLGYYTRGSDEGYPLDPDLILNDGGDEYRADFDRFLARVRRDAAREALDGLAIDLAVTSGYTEAEEVRDYRDAHYPETED